jgi:hypothetical protein
MNKEKYENLLLRFAKELNEIGITREQLDLVGDHLDRSPNAAVSSHEETTDRFIYRHDGYSIEATRIVKLTVKKCKP